MSTSEVRPFKAVLDEVAVMLAARPRIRVHMHPLTELARSSDREFELDSSHPAFRSDQVDMVHDLAVPPGYAYVECTDCPDAEPPEQPADIPDRWYVMHEHEYADSDVEVHTHPAGVVHPQPATNADHTGVGEVSWEDLRVQLVEDPKVQLAQRPTGPGSLDLLG